MTTAKLRATIHGPSTPPGRPDVQFLFDFGSPNAFLAHCVLGRVSDRTGVVVRYIPVLLGGVFKATGNRSPSQVFLDVPAKLRYERLEIDRFVADHGIDGYQLNPNFPLNTLTIMRGAVAADEMGVFSEYVYAVFDFMWVNHRKMDVPEVIEASLADVGLEAAAILTRADSAGVKARLKAYTAEAVERGVFGSPSFLVDGNLYFGKDKLSDVERHILRLKP